MSTRAELEEIFAAQRARRRSPPHAPSGRGRNLIGALAVIVILVASGAAMYFAVQITTPKADGTATALPSASPSVYVTSSFTSVPATLVVMQVCTDIPDGRLHVRFAAGNGSEVRGYLAEGEVVQVALESKMFQGEVWQRITSPVAGWVNARFICKQEGEE